MSILLKEDNIDINKVSDLEDKILEILNNTKLNMSETVWLVGKLLINIGCSIEKMNAPKCHEEAFVCYTNNPTIGNAFISAGYDMHDWLKL